MRSLRMRLGITNAMLIAAVFVSFGLLRYGTVAYRARSAFDERLSSDAQFLASHIKPAVASGPALLREELSTDDLALLDRLQLYFFVTDLQGRVVPSDTYSPHMLRLVASEELGRVLMDSAGLKSVRTSDGTSYRYASIPLRSNGTTAAFLLHVARPTEQLDLILSDYLRVYAYFLPFVLLVSGAVGWFLADRAIRPFGHLATSAGRITALNLGEPIASPHTGQEVQRLVTAFNEMGDRLNQSFQQLRRFNADVAHELRTPLAILRGETELALSTSSTADDLRAVLSSNMEEIDRLTELVNQMLVLSEAESGGQVMAKEEFGLNDVLEDLVEQIRPLASMRGITFRDEPFPDMLMAGDELWMRRAILNVLDNAIKYSSDNGVIEVRCRVDGAMARVEIRDYGIGIAPADLPRVFDRLYRADPARNRASGGLGLGLSLVKWVIEAHGGNVRLWSELDRGTLCTIELPLASGLPASAAGTRMQPAKA